MNCTTSSSNALCHLETDNNDEKGTDKSFSTKELACMDNSIDNNQAPFSSIDDLLECIYKDNVNTETRSELQFCIQPNRIHGVSESGNVSVIYASGERTINDGNDNEKTTSGLAHVDQAQSGSVSSNSEFKFSAYRSNLNEISSLSGFSAYESSHKCITGEGNRLMLDIIGESSCSSPPVTPPYSDGSLGLNLPTLNDGDDERTSSVVNSFTERMLLDIPALGDWKIVGDPTEISYISAVGGPYSIQAYFSSIRHRGTDTIVNVGDVILLRRPTQEWFDRCPLVMEVVSVMYTYEAFNFSEGTVIVKLRRYFGIFQVSCMLPDIAHEMVNREAVVFMSESATDILTPECSFVGRGLILSLSEYYRYWAELTRLRHGRGRRRCLTEMNVRERWQDWLERPDNTFVLCGHYDHISKTLESL